MAVIINELGIFSSFVEATKHQESRNLSNSNYFKCKDEKKLLTA